MKIQSLYSVPTIEHVQQREQLHLFTTTRESGEQLRLGGDELCCSPGHTAKYTFLYFDGLEDKQDSGTTLVHVIVCHSFL